MNDMDNITKQIAENIVKRRMFETFSIIAPDGTRVYMNKFLCIMSFLYTKLFFVSLLIGLPGAIVGIIFYNFIFCHIALYALALSLTLFLSYLMLMTILNMVSNDE